MEGAAIAELTELQVGLPTPHESGAVPEDQPPAVAQTFTRRERDVRHKRYGQQDEILGIFARQVSSSDCNVATEGAAKLWELTLLTKHNHVANQLALAGIGGVALLLEFAKARVCRQATSNDAVNMALLVLENLSTNVQLHHEMVHDSALLHFLLDKINNETQRAMRLNAAKVLVNLTFSNPQFQEKVAQAGAVSAALVLIRESDLGLVRQGAWILSHVTAGHGCTAREELGAQMDVLERLRGLLKNNEDRVTKIRVCEVLYNLARGDVRTHSNLVRAGVVPELISLINPISDHRQEPEVVAPALLALAALTAAGRRTPLLNMVFEPQLVPYLSGILGYSNLVTRDYDMSRVMMAAHALMFSLGPFMSKGKAVASVSGGCPDHVEEQLLQGSGYVSLQQSLLALGIEQPQCVAASLGKDLGGSHCFVADTMHQVNVELLPLLKHDNARMVINACARLYQIAVCLRNHPEGRLVLTNGFLVVALRDLLASEHSAVLQAALSLADALASVPELVPLLVEKGVMDMINTLSDQQPVTVAADGQNSAAKAETVTAAAWKHFSQLHSKDGQVLGDAGGIHTGAVTACRSDPLVKMLAERALVTMFLAKGSWNEASVHVG